MTEAPSSERLTSCFSQWEEALKGGQLLTATYVAGNEPGLVAALQQRIDEYFSCSAAAFADVTRTQDTAALPDSKPKPTLHVPGFTILEELGTGGMGAVYRVHQSVLDREWAMKFVRPDRLTASAKARFLSEAVAMAKLKHPNIIHVHDYHEPQSANDVPYLLMPVYPTSLLKQAARIREDRKQTVRVLAGIAAGVAYLHERGFLHRDIKPHNILLTETDVPIVSDFGLVKDLAKADGSSDGMASPGETYPAAAGQTQIGSVMGTTRYMAPEQAAGQTQLANPTWDVWSIGVLAHELLTGHAPPSSSSPHHLLNPATPDNPAPRTYCPTLEPELERIVQKCLARDSHDRYPSAAPLAADLDKWLNPPKSRWPRVLTGLAALVALVTLAVALWPKKPTPPPDPRDELLATLARDGKADLLGKDGKPKYAKIIAGQAFATEREWVTDKAYTVESQRGVVVELVPAEAIQHGFTLKGKVRLNDDADLTGRAGFVIGRRPGQAAEGEVHELIEFGVGHLRADAVLKPLFPPNTSRLAEFTGQCWLFGDQPQTTRDVSRAGQLAGLHRQPAPFKQPSQDEEYHELKLDVTPEAVQWSANGHHIPPSQKKSTIETVFHAHEREVPLERPYIFDGGGGIGVIVWHGSASFKELTIERRLPPAK